MEELEPYQLKDPATLIREVAEQVELEEDSAWLALVHHPSTEQRLVKVRRLPVPALLDSDEDISDDLREAIESLVGPRKGVPEHLAITIVVRPGYTVFAPNEVVWHKGWRYANHLASAYSGEIMLVTEHGWLDFMSDHAGSTPCMVRAAG